MLKLRRRYTLKITQGYAPKSRQDDEKVDKFYKDAELAMQKVRTQHTIVTGDFNAKVGRKQKEEEAIGNCGINSRNNRGGTLVEFSELNRVRT